MTDSIESPNHCEPSSKNSKGGSIIFPDEELLEDGDQKGKNEDFPISSHCENGRGDYHISLEQDLPTGWDTAERKQNLGLHVEVGDAEDGTVPKSQLQPSFFTNMRTTFGNIGNTIKNSFSNVITFDSPDIFVNEESISERNSYDNEGEEDYTESDFNSEEQCVIVNTCPKHGFPILEEEANSKDLVVNWLNRLSEVTWENKCVPSTSNRDGSQIPDHDFKVLTMDMLTYSSRRQFADLKILIGKSIYKVDSCILSAQSTKLRELIFWACSNNYRPRRNDCLPHLRLTDMSSFEFEALLIYMYTGGYLVPSVINDPDKKEPTQRFLDLLSIYGIPYVSGAK